MSSEPTALATGTIRLRNVTKVFDRNARKLWATALPWGTVEPRHEMRALDEVDLDIQPGEAVGIIGANGAGKSTILKLLAGVMAPTTGTVQCVGRVGSMIELGLGFHPELTGHENARATATILGLTPSEADAAMADIIEFAGLQDAMDTPLKHYSTGMRARLGFAVSVHVPADVLLIDEVLAVGDSEFQLRCVDRIAEMQTNGTTLVFVSHAVWLVNEVCERVIHVKRGRIVDDGPGLDVIHRYLMPRPIELDTAPDPSMRFRSFEVRSSLLQPKDGLDLEAEVVVTDDTPEPFMALDLTWPTSAPDTPFVRNFSPLPAELRRAGGYRVRGRTTGVPVDRGHVEVSVALVEDLSQRVLDREHGEFSIDGPTTRQPPQIAVELEFALARTNDKARDDVAAAPRLSTAGGPLMVEARQLTKRFRAGLRRGGIRAGTPSWLEATEQAGSIVALDGIDLEVPRGQRLGVIGPNGSGKSTFLKVVAGVMAPTSGSMTTRGRMVSMLELGIGFHPDLNGEENLRETAGLLGMSPDEIAGCLPQIMEFAAIGDAVGSPVKQYSSGMKARLGLALAVHSRPELLLIDEALAVGDRAFQKQAVKAIRRLATDGTTVVFVSHDLGLVEDVCDRVIRLEQGVIVDDGPASEVVDRAGGTGWQGGVIQHTSPVRVDKLELHPRQVPADGRLDFDGIIEVFEPSPTVRIEFCYMAPRGRSIEWSGGVGLVHVGDLTTERAERTFFSQVVVPAGGPLSEIGRYRFSGCVPDNPLLGELYVVVSAVDEREGIITSEAWQDLKVGSRIQMEHISIPMEVEWQLIGEFDSAAASADPVT